MCFFSPKFAFLDKHFVTRRKLFDTFSTAQNLGKEGNCHSILPAVTTPHV